MATLQDVQSAIDTYDAAVSAEQTAVTNLNAVEAVVGGALTSESETFQAARVIFDAAVTAARDAAGFGAALAARESAGAAKTAAEIALKTLMAEYLAGFGE